MAGRAPNHADGEPVLLTVAICTRNRARLMAAAVESVLPHLGPDAELLIVDNASSDDTDEVAARFIQTQPRVRSCREPELGLSAARNRALEEAQGAFVVYLDDDATAQPGWLEQYRAFLAAHSGLPIAAVGGRVVPRYEAPPPRWLAEGENLLDRGDREMRFEGRGGPWGGNLALNRDLALNCGGFDPAFGRKGGSLLGGEETELFHRLRQAGGEIWWLPGADIDHLVPQSRLTLACQCRGTFCLGRSSAMMRLRAMSGRGHRLAFRIGRVCLAPLHILYYWLSSLTLLLLGRVRLAAKMFFRSMRTAGFAWQLMDVDPTARREGLPMSSSNADRVVQDVRFRNLETRQDGVRVRQSAIGKAGR